MRFYFMSFLLVLSLSTYAQRASSFKIDSLRTQVREAKEDTTKVHSLARLAQAYEGIDSVLTFSNAYKSLELAESIKYERGIVHAKMALGGAYMDYYDLDKAERYLEESIELGEKLRETNPTNENLKLLATSKYNLAITYSYRGENKKEIAIVREVIPIVEKLKDTSFLANIHNNLGITYMNLGQLDNSYKNFKISEKLYRRVDDPKRAIFNKLSINTLLYNLDSIPELKANIEEARTLLELTPESIDWHLLETDLGMYYTKIGDYPSAISSYDNALELINKNKLFVNLAPLYQKYAFTYETSGDFVMARKYMAMFLEDAIKNKKGISTFKGYYKISQYAAANNNYKDAYSELLIALDIYDSLEVQTTLEKFKNLELEFETAKREKEILALQNAKNEAELALEKRKSQTYLYGIIIGTLIFGLLIGYLLYRNKLKQQRRKERIYQEELKTLKHQQEADIYAAMIDGQEKERKRLAIDLHDGLGGRLSGISLNLSKLDKDEPMEYPKKQLQKVMKDLNDSLMELRGIARNMMPETLMKFGLEAALKDYCSSMNGNNTKVTLQFYGSEEGIGSNQLVTIYRVIQELINNAIKHANASEVLVQFMREGNNLDITVEDNGIGLNTKSIQQKSDGMGLSNLRTRVAYLRGNLDFQSAKNEGTTVNVHLSINAA